jgi:hypothetical protein
MTVPGWTRDAPEVLRCAWPLKTARGSRRVCAAPAKWWSRRTGGRSLCDWHMAHEAVEYHTRHPDVPV